MAVQPFNLASFAASDETSLGRIHPETPHPYRTAYQRDRERIIHSSAFRRLEYKTQVFVNHEGDEFRTRLTHTIEVAQVSRSIARALRLNEDLAESVALVHDLGHTPFGHAGEEALHRKILELAPKERGAEKGFFHNRQSLRVVDVLEDRYPNFTGLNLTFETREGIVKHETIYDDFGDPEELDDFHSEWKPTLEAQLVNFADEIAYNSHDLDDGLRSGIFDWTDLDGIALWDELVSDSVNHYPELDRRKRRHHIIRLLINRQVSDLIGYAQGRIRDLQLATLDDVRNAQECPMRFSPDFAQKLKSLKAFLFERMYRNYRLVKMAGKAQRILSDIFDAYLADPRQLPPRFAALVETNPAWCIVRDYVAGMTDRYAIQEHKKLFDPSERVL